MDFLRDFVKATDHLPSPQIFRLWCGIAALAGAMGRKLWAQIHPDKDHPTYGNHYIVLVAPAGVGKSQAFGKVRRILDQTGNAKFSPDHTTYPDAMDMLGKYFTGNRDDGPMDARTFNFMTDEIQLMLNDKENTDWYQTLAQLWDCPPYTEKGTKTQGHDMIHEPYVNLLLGAQPAWFAIGFPKGANLLGLPSRLLFIYSDQKVDLDLYAVPDETAWLRAQDHITRVANSHGQFHVPLKLRDQMFEDRKNLPSINLAGMSEAYHHRRFQHLTKLTLICAMAVHPDKLELTIEDWEYAKTLLFEAEQNMYQAMAFIGTSESYLHERALIEFVKNRFALTGKPVSEPELRKRMSQDFAPNMRQFVLDNFVSTKQLKREQIIGGYGFVPGPNA